MLENDRYVDPGILWRWISQMSLLSIGKLDLLNCSTNGCFLRYWQNASIKNTIEDMLVPGKHVMNVMIPGSMSVNLYTPLEFCRPLLWFSTGRFAPPDQGYFVGMECTVTSKNTAAPHRLTRINNMTPPKQNIMKYSMYILWGHSNLLKEYTVLWCYIFVINTH